MKKCLVISITIILFSIIFAPTINATIINTSKNNDLVQITTEICGINEMTPNKMKITKEEVEKLENLFNSLNSKLTSIKSRSNAVEIFKETLATLDKYGLLPEEINIEQVLKLITSGYKESTTIKKLNEMNIECQNLFDNESNYLCLVVGKTDYTYFSGPPRVRILWPIMVIFWWDVMYKIWEIIPSDLFPLLDEMYEIVGDLLWYLWGYSTIFHQFNPVARRNIVSLGSAYIHDWNPASGWLTTIGLNGIKQWDGAFWGNLPLPPRGIFETCPGIFGFRGIKIMIGGDFLYLGSANWVKIEYN